MEEKFAKTISILFHPVLIPSWFALILFSSNTYISLLIPIQLKYVLFTMIFICTAIFPILFVLIMVRRKVVDNIYLTKREDRIYPFAITAMFYFIAYYLIRQLPLYDVFAMFLLGSTFLVFIAMLISFFWKISTHLMGLGGLLGGLSGIAIRFNLDFNSIIIFGVLVSGLLGFARLKLSAHKPLQVYAGFLLAFFVMISILLI